MFSKITQWLGSFRETSAENSPANQNLLTRKESYEDPTASAETAELVLGNLGQQFAAKNVQQIKPNGTPTKDAGYIVPVHPQELGIGRWSSKVNPNTVTTKAVEKVLDDFGIKDESLRTKAVAKLGNNDLTIELGKEQHLVKTGDFGRCDLMLVTTNNLGGVDVKFDAGQINWLKGLAKLEKVNESATKGQSNQPVTTETTLLGTTAVLNLPKAMELPKLDARPLLILGAEAAVPLGSIGVTAGGVAWTSYQIGEMGYRKWEQQTRADALPLPPTILTNKAEEPVKPETTVADKPKPQAQPIPDETDLPKGEIAVRPKAQPQTQPKADNPTSTIESVPSPYKPNQPNSPQIDPTKLIPPIIGASTATVGKVFNDKVNENSFSEKYSNTEKYIGEKLNRPDPNNPSAIHPRLPDYDGKKTSGILIVNGEEIDIVSGYDGPTALTKEKIPGMNNILKAHVEAHVAVIMRQEGIKEATLFINQKPCLDIRGVGCETMLERMLPKGTKLTIIAPNGYKKTFEGK